MRSVLEPGDPGAAEAPLAALAGGGGRADILHETRTSSSEGGMRSLTPAIIGLSKVSLDPPWLAGPDRRRPDRAPW